MFDFYRVVAAVPKVSVGDVNRNTAEIIAMINVNKDADFIVFPELCISGYTCADLFFQSELLISVKKSIKSLKEESEKVKSVIVAGAPLIIDGKLFDCSVVLQGGKVRGIQVKTNVNYSYSSYDMRWFSSARDLKASYISAAEVGIEDDYAIPVGNDIIFNLGGSAKFSVEIGNDLASPIPQSSKLCLAGAEIILNSAASEEIVTKRKFVGNLVSHQSSSLNCAYVYVSAGEGESTTDVVYSGHSVICENGCTLKENKNIADGDYFTKTDIDLGKIKADRIKNKSLSDYGCSNEFREIFIDYESDCDGSLYSVNKLSFVPSVKAERVERCLDIFNIQVAGLKKRAKTIGGKMVLGVSGGLDSTLTLLVCVEAARQLGIPLENVIGLTLPCFGTTQRTHSNAWELMKTLGITSLEIDIKDACTQHCRDIGHPEDLFNTTYENVQARERMQVLMDYACKVGGFVVGTGDLSELALGWCTYNADHMSMYGTNAGVPKSLIRWIISSLVENGYFPESADVLRDIIDTPISPELLPPDEKGNIAQQTEEIIGPYALHDFFLYHFMRFGYSPSKIYHLAKLAFKDDFDDIIILKCLEVFYRRFFTQQFKRSCLPDGAKVGSVALSPRGDLCMASDSSYNIWLKEIENLKK